VDLCVFAVCIHFGFASFVVWMPLLEILDLYGISHVSNCWTLAREQMRRMKMAEIRFLRAAAEYSMADPKRHEDIKE
jgi:hypothetical protein